MKIITSIKKMQQCADRAKRAGKAIGFVPTMGYLHHGHLSLARQAKKDNDIAVMSVFVNPIQFGQKEDFKKYPRDMKRDAALAADAGIDIIFYPSSKVMYPQDYQTYVEVIELSKHLCGKSRPGHFKGVATVVIKLFNIVKPDIAYFGQKDAQQAAVIEKMVSDLNMDVEIKVMPIVREPDGLAMSSRNRYLSPTQRKDALVLKNALQKAVSMIISDEKNPEAVKLCMREIINSVPSSKIEYISIIDAASLRDIKEIKGNILIALAVRIGKTRLIDNVKVRI
jgi:pantoate--beta-alanine ligase